MSEERIDAQPEPEVEAQGQGPEQASGRDPGSEALAHALRLSFLGLKVAMVVLAGVYLASGFFYAHPNEVVIKLSFGKPVKVNRGAGRGKGYVIDSQSGYHYKWPWQEVVRIPLGEQVLTIADDFWPGESLPGRPKKSLDVKKDGYLLTGDVNLIHMQLLVKYRARSDEQGALDYAFRFYRQEDPKEEQGDALLALLRRMAVESTIETVACWGVLDVRSKTRTREKGPAVGLISEIENRVRRRMRAFEERNGFSLGVELTSVEPLGDPAVPAAVKPAFDRWQQAQSEKQALIDDAKRQAASIVQEAQGKRATILAQAESYRTRLIATAKADAGMLRDLLPAYRQSAAMAQILRDWHYARTVEELLGQAEGSFVLHRPVEGGSSELRIMLNRPLKKAATERQEQGEREGEGRQ